MSGREGAGEERACEVCSAEPIVGVACSSLGPVSFAYGRRCLDSGAEPYGMLVGTAAMCGGPLADWCGPMIAATLAVAGKTREEFDADVAAATREFDADMDRMFEQEAREAAS